MYSKMLHPNVQSLFRYNSFKTESSSSDHHLFRFVSQYLSAIKSEPSNNFV